MAYTEDVNINLNVLAGAMGGITAISSGMSALTSTFGQFGTEAVDNFGTVDGLLVTTAALIASFGVQATQAFGEFEQGMKIVQTVSNQSSAAIQELSEKANQLSVNYRTAIGDITDGLQTLGRAGLNSAETQLEVLESGLQTAKLEGRNLNSVLEELIQNTAMLGGDLKSVDFGKQSDYLNSLMVGTSMTAPIDSHDISQTLQYAGGTAAAAGANLDNKEKLEDLMGTVAAFAQKGVTGSMAGTALRAFFTKPASQDKSVTEALGSIGLSPDSLWEDGGESMKKVSDQIAIIQNRMDALHMSTMDQVELWGKIVGPKMGQQMMKLESSSIRELTSDIQQAKSAQELSHQTLDTYNQKVNELGQQGQLIFRQLGENAVMVLTPVVDILNKIASILSHPIASRALFYGFTAIFVNGLRAAWGMLKTIGAQVKELLLNAEQAITNLAQGTAPLSNGLSVSASRAELLASKLADSNAEMRAIQGNLLGINNTSWFANGGNPLEKVEKGVIASANQNVIIGGKTEGGIQFGEDGRIYTAEEAKKMKDDLVKKSELRAEIESSITEKEQQLAEIDNIINQRQELITKANSTFANIPGMGNHYRSISGARKAIDDQLDRIDLELQTIPNPREELLNKMALEGVTEDDVIRARDELKNPKEDLSSRKDALNKRLDELEDIYIQGHHEAVGQTVRGGIRTTDRNENEIKNIEGYISAVPDNASITFQKHIDDFNRPKGEKKHGKDAMLYDPHSPEFNLSEQHQQWYKELAQEVHQVLIELKNIERMEGKNKSVNPKAYDFVDEYENIKAPPAFDAMNEARVQLEDLDAELAAASEEALRSKASLTSEKATILAELEKAKADAALLPDSGIHGMKRKDLDREILTLEDDLQARMVMMENSMYEAQMSFLKERAKGGDELARFAYKHNQELAKLGLHDLGNGYKQLYSPKNANLSGYQKDEKFISTFATKSKASGQSVTATVKGFTGSALSSIRTQGIIGTGKEMYNKLGNRGQEFLKPFKGEIGSVAKSLSRFRASLETTIKGVEGLRAGINASIKTTTVGMNLAGKEFSAILEMLSSELGITEEQLAILIATESMETAEISTSIANRILMNMAEEQGIRLSEMDRSERQRLIAIIREEIVERSRETAGLGGAVGGATGEVKGLKGAASALVGFMGGPMMVAMMGFTEAMRIIQEMQSQWQERMNKAQTQLSESMDNLTKAKESVANLLRDENSSISEAQIEQFTDYQVAAIQTALVNKGSYSDMVNNEIQVVKSPELSDAQKEQQKADEEAHKKNQWYTPDETAMNNLEESAETLSLTKDENIQALKENTAELNAATYAYSQAEAAKVKEFTDGIYGFNGLGSSYSDGSIPLSLNIVDTVQDFFNKRKNGFLETDSPLLTKSQSSSDYAGSTELAAIFAANSYKTEHSFKSAFWSSFWGNLETEESRRKRTLEDTLRNTFGTDSDRIISLMRNMDSKMGKASGMDALQSANLTFAGMDEKTAGYAQMFFKDNKTELQKLGKQMFRYEEQYGFSPQRTASRDIDSLMKGVKPGSGVLPNKGAITKGQLQNLIKNASKRKLTVTDKNLVTTVKNFMKMSGGKLDEGNFIAMGSLQQLQDMYTVANEQVAPGINQTVQGVNNTVAQTTIAGANAGNASNNAGSAAANAAAIASFLGAKAQETAEHAEYIKLQREGYEFENEEQFRSKLAKGELPRAEREILQTLEGTSWSLMNGDNDPDHIEQNAKRLYNQLDKDSSYQAKLNTATWGILQYAEGATKAAYSASNIGEYGGNSAGGDGGGGQGSGGGSDDKDKSGTKKERVDLVLCNKKEIPKLNVNLFKKPPSFTVLNKNFRVRDIKISSQDKPKAIMNAVKNGIIETQKRMDPKIIQDEESVYDPVAASDGTSTTPSGTTKTTT